MQRAMRSPFTLAFVVLVSFALYAPTIGFGFTHLDDDKLILDEAAHLAEPGSALRAFERPYFAGGARDHTYYRPLVTASYALDVGSSDVDPAPLHLTNVLLHALASGLGLLVLRQLGFAENAARFAALWFALHPALTSAVAWLPARPELLLAVFTLGAFWFWLRAQQQSTKRWFFAGAHGLAWLLALLAKESALVLPLVCLAHARLLLDRPWRELVPRPVLAGWLGASIVYVALRSAALSGELGLAGLSLSGFLDNAPLLLTSLGKLLVPVELAALGTRADTSLVPGLLALGLVALGFRFARVRREVLSFALLAFALPVVPSLPASGSLALESRLYVPALGLSYLVAELATSPALAALRGRAFAVAVGLLALFAVVTFEYSDSFRDRRAFSEAAVRGAPHSALAHRNLGLTYQLEGDAAAAKSEYRAALAADPAEPVVHNNLAVIHMAAGELDQAETALRRELELNPGYTPAQRNLALVLDATGRAEEAVPHWEAVVERNPRDHQGLRALTTYYAARDAARAAQYRTKLGEPR